MKDAYFFSHDSNTRSDTKIMSLLSVYDFRGYGWFWAIIETMRDSTDYKLPLTSKYCMKNYSSLLRCTEEEAKEFIYDCIDEFELFESDGEFFWSDSLLRRMNKANEKRAKNSENAKKGGRPKKQAEQIEAPAEEKPTPKEVTFSAEVESITDSLCRKLRENNEKAKLPADLKKWNSAIDALHRIDGYEFDVIEKVCNWSQDNSFWKQNILSAPKLREKFAQLLLAMQEDERRKTNAESKGSFSNGTRTDSEDQRPTINIPINPRIHELDIEAQLAKLRERAKAVGAPV